MKRILAAILILFVVFPFGVTERVLAEYIESGVYIEKGAKGEEVKLYQQALIFTGYLDGNADGDFGKKTEEAVRSFQKGNSLEVTGIITDADAKKLSTIIKTYANRAAKVAVMNGHAIDVFMPDGNNFDVKKFHKHTDKGDYYSKVTTWGEWVQTDTFQWRVTDMLLHRENVDSYIKVSCNVKFAGDSFKITNYKYVIARKKFIDSNDPSKTSGLCSSPDDAPYFTVTLDLVK